MSGNGNEVIPSTQTGGDVSYSMKFFRSEHMELFELPRLANELHFLKSRPDIFKLFLNFMIIHKFIKLL